jgi:hypothetical protein
VQEGAGEKRKAEDDEAQDGADSKKAKTEDGEKKEDADRDVADEYVMVAREEATNEDLYHKEEVCLIVLSPLPTSKSQDKQFQAGLTVFQRQLLRILRACQSC